MKKIIPILLAVALLLQSSLITPFVGAEDETGELKGAIYGEELITDGGFDDDILDESNPITSAGWRYRNSDHNSVIKENGETYGFATNNRIFRVANNSYGAAQPIRISSGKTYRLKFDMSGGTSAGKLNVAIMYKASSPAVWKFPIEKVYTSPTESNTVISVTDYIDTTDLPVADADSNGFFIWLYTNAGNIVNVDNFSLVEVSSVCENPLVEEDFENFSFDFVNNLSTDKKTLWQKVNGNYWQVYGTEGKISDAVADTTNGTVWVPYSYDNGANNSIRLRDWTSRSYYTYYLRTFIQVEKGVTYDLSVDINGRGNADDVGLVIRPLASIDDSGFSWYDSTTYYANYATDNEDYFKVGTGTSFTNFKKSFTPTMSGWVGISFGCMGKSILFDNVKVTRSHAWESSYTVDVMPTENTVGEKSIHCENCYKRKDITEITLASLSGQTYDNVLDFEEGCVWDADGSTWYLPGLTGYTSANVYSGKASVQQSVSSAGSVSYTLPVDLVAGEGYKLLFKYRTTTGDGAPFATITVGENELGTVSTNSTFQTYEKEFTAASNDDKVVFTFGNTDCLTYIDDIAVVPLASEELIDITCSSDENGTAAVSDTKIVEGQPVTFTATANDGYVFDSWVDSEGTVVSRNSVYKAIGITEALSLKATFAEMPATDDSTDFESADDYKLSGEAFLYTPEYKYYDEAYKHHGTSSVCLDGYGGAYSDTNVLKAGLTYKVSFWYYQPTTTTATLQVQLGDSDTPVLYTQGCDARDMWHEAYAVFTPEEDAKLCIKAFGGAATNVGGPVYIDDIKVEAYHTVAVDKTLGQYISTSANEPTHNSTVDISIKKKADGKYFFGWLKDGKVIEEDGYTKSFVATKDVTIDKDTYGTPIYTEKGDTNGDGKVNIADLVYNNIKLSDDYTLGNDVDKSGAVDATDFTKVREKLLGIEIEEASDGYLEQERIDIVGSSEDKTNWIYQLGTDGVMVRETEFDSGLSGDPVELIQISDIHIFGINDRDIADNNPTVMSSYKYTYWGMNDGHIPNLRKAMEYASYFDDQTIVSGDSMTFLSWGGIEQVQDEIWARDPSALVTLGNHELVMKNSGKVAETLTVASRYNMLASEWRHNVFYTSRIINNKVMVVQMENSLGKYYDEQVEQLQADITKARELGLMILIFQHVPMSTNNPADTAVDPIRQNDSSSGTFNYYAVTKDLVKPDLGGATTEVYNLITNNADVIKGVFCGHMHSDYYTEILATTNDGKDTVIPQYVLTSNAYDNGHVMKITVK